MSELILPASYVRERQRKQQQAAAIERRIADEIGKEYPGHLFSVEVEIDHGHIYVDHSLLEGTGARYFVNKNDGIRAVLRVCGEILERVNLPRAAVEHLTQYDDATALAKDAFSAR